MALDLLSVNEVRRADRNRISGNVNNLEAMGRNGVKTMHRLVQCPFRSLVLAIFQLTLFTPVSAGSPSEEMRATMETVLATLQDPNFKGAEKRDDRHNKLRKIIDPKFDFAEMGKRSLGTYWQRRTPEEQKTFIDLFTDLVETSYLDALDSYNGEKVMIGMDNQHGEFAEVRSKILTKKGENFAVDYKLHQSSGTWKVYDVVLENISLINNYRSQFNRVIAKSSFEELLNKLKEKQFNAPGKKHKA